jgi:diguanylate cyclase (GGDEF)-like protein/PAS domain S-box-containing protein
MNRRTGLLRFAGAAWLVFSAIALASDSYVLEVGALLAGVAMMVAMWRLLRTAERERRQWRDILDAMQAGIVVYDSEDRLLLANAEFRQLFGLSELDAAVGTPYEQLLRVRVGGGLVPEAAGREEAWIANRVAQRRERGDSTEQRRMSNGRWRRIIEQRLPDGALLAVSIDVTDQVEKEQALAAAHGLLNDAVEALPEGFAMFDRDDRLVLCNQRYRDIYANAAPAMVPGASFESIVRYGLEHGQYPEAAADPEGWLAERLRRHRETSGEPILQELPGNRWLRIDERRTASGGIAGVRADVTEMVQQRQELESMRATLEQLSLTDALTGLANRRCFDTRLAEETQRARRHGTPLALLMIDVDHFKRYNDHRGHVQGDAALRAVADVLREQVRRPGELVARYGGEEFSVLMPQVASAQAQRVAERCVAAMNAAALPHGDSPTAEQVTISIGCANFQAAAGEDAAAFVKRADAALYHAKSQGRARAVSSTAEA